MASLLPDSLAPMDFYDIVFDTAKRLGHEAEFLAKFGSREEYAKKVQRLEASA